MNIVYTTDDKFAGKVGISICSLLENNKDMEEIHVYILGLNISKMNCDKYDCLAKKYGRTIEVIKINAISSYLNFEFDTNGWNPIVLARLLLDIFLPADIDKVLYLDGDTIVLGSLEALWKMDMGNSVIGGCIEPTVDKKRKCSLGMESIPYINAGVLFVNMKLWREKDTGRKILNYYMKQKGNLFANDQDAINGFLKDELCYLPPCYNFYNIYWHYPYWMLCKLMGKAKYYSKPVFNESKEKPIIIHYLGEERPWRKGNRHRYLKNFKFYQEESPWRDEKDENGWEIYYLCWYIFNFIIKPFPMIRYHIINKLIPLFMRWRKKQLSKKA